MSRSQFELEKVRNLLVSPSQVARLLDVSTQQVRQLAEMDDLPVAGKTPGGHRRYELQCVLRLKEAREEQREGTRHG